MGERLDRRCELVDHGFRGTRGCRGGRRRRNLLLLHRAGRGVLRAGRGVAAHLVLCHELAQIHLGSGPSFHLLLVLFHHLQPSGKAAEVLRALALLRCGDCPLAVLVVVLGHGLVGLVGVLAEAEVLRSHWLHRGQQMTHSPLRQDRHGLVARDLDAALLGHVLLEHGLLGPRLVELLRRLLERGLRLCWAGRGDLPSLFQLLQALQQLDLRPSLRRFLPVGAEGENHLRGGHLVHVSRNKNAHGIVYSLSLDCCNGRRKVLHDHAVGFRWLSLGLRTQTSPKFL